MIPLLSKPSFRWACPSCGRTDVSDSMATRYHNCTALAGLSAPMVLEGTKAKHVVMEREDYEGSDIAQRDENGKVVMSILTVRDDGQDCTVLAPTATATLLR